MKLSTFQIGTARKRGEGLRLGTVRFLPRGVKKKDYAKLNYFDVWLPILAPSRPLLSWLKTRIAKQGEATPQTLKTFFARYRRELNETNASQVIQTLATLSKNNSHQCWLLLCR